MHGNVPPQSTFSQRARISESGKWIIKLGTPETYLHGSERAATRTASWLGELACSELETLQSHGVNVVTHAFIAADKVKLYTVTPHISPVYAASSEEFDSRIQEPVFDYLMSRLRSREPAWYLEDISRPSQYLKLIRGGNPFLADVEPYCTQQAPPPFSPTAQLINKIMGDPRQ